MVFAAEVQDPSFGAWKAEAGVSEEAWADFMTWAAAFYGTCFCLCGCVYDDRSGGRVIPQNKNITTSTTPITTKREHGQLQELRGREDPAGAPRRGDAPDPHGPYHDHRVYVYTCRYVVSVAEWWMVG